MSEIKGFFISIEGIDGSGKTTVCARLALRMAAQGPVLVREPGGTAISEKIREMLLDAGNSEIHSKTEAMLYAASRARLVEEVISPALEQGKLVIADRFIDSTLAYQGYGRGIDLTFLKELNMLSTRGITPDLTILLDLDPVMAKQRKGQGLADRLELEGLAFQQQVRRGYLALAAADRKRVKMIPADQDVEEIIRQAEALIKADI